MRLRQLPVLLFVLSSLAPVSRADREVSLAELWRRFQTATSLDTKRAVVEDLSTWTEREQVQTLLRWIQRLPDDPRSVALLARSLVDRAPEAASRHLRGLLRKKTFVPSRRAILRVLLDGPRMRDFGRQDFGRLPLTEPAAFALASELTAEASRLPVADAARAWLALRRVIGKLESAPDKDAWRAIGEKLHHVPALGEVLETELVRRIQGVLPRPRSEDLTTWPGPYLDRLCQEGEPWALTAWLIGAQTRRSRERLGEVRTRRHPASVPALVEALALVEPHSALFYRIQATLLDLTGTQVPPDPDQWRSWIAGHRGVLDAEAVLPPTASSEASVGRGIAFLLERQLANGSFAYDARKGDSLRTKIGATALATYALRKAGVPGNAPPLERAAAFLLAHPDDARPQAVRTYNYGASLAVMALESLGKKRWRRELAEITISLIGGQMDSGGWTYTLPLGTRTNRSVQVDLSNTQYSVLGLRSAVFADVPVPRDVWEGVLGLMRNAEIETTGEWRYLIPAGDTRKGMAAIAAASLLIARSQLEPGLDLDDVLADQQIVRALRSMARKYGSAKCYAGIDLYTLYSIERVGALFGVHSFDGVPWYEEGVRALRKRQRADGGWGWKSERIRWWYSWGRNIDTCYALLFMRRATTPVFSAGLDVPSDPAQPITRVAPAQGFLTPAPGAPKGGTTHAGTPAGRGAHRLLGELRASCARTLRGMLEATQNPTNRLAVWKALAAIDPLDVGAQAACGRILDTSGRWVTEEVLAISLPAGAPSQAMSERIRSLLERTFREALAAATADGVPKRDGRALGAFALEVKRAARATTPGTARRAP